MTAVLTSVPPLAAGDLLAREEFLRRWQAHPEIKKAELIGGMVYMSSPVSADHGGMDNRVTTWLGVYAASTPGCEAGNNVTTFVLRDCTQPDGHLRLLPESGGTSWVEEKYLRGVPELLAEVSLSSSAYDLHQKLELFQEAGVKEYLVVLLHEQEVRWHHLARRTYHLLTSSADGILRSRVFPGLWLDSTALLAENMAQVLATLQQGILSPEHARFVARLNKRRTS